MQKRMIQILSLFIVILLLLSIRLFKLQIYPNDKVVLSYQNYQQEDISDMKYMILDTNGRDLMNYSKQYILVIDTKPFSLNNYEETLQGLMALNFIMKSENLDFNYTDIMKESGKIYYNISENTYKKINSLKNIKGIYTYIKDYADIKKAWNISSMLSNILNEEEITKDSLEGKLYDELKNNETPKSEFYLDDRAVYAKQSVSINKNNRNLQLTIDRNFEDKIRKILDDKKYKSLNNVGVSIVESDTGKIKALMQKEESEANINLGIEQIGYEPGSIYKIITLGSALDMGLLNVNDYFVCDGVICKDAHGNLSVEEAFEKSCNDVFAQIGDKVGYDKLIAYSKNQGLYQSVLNFKGNNKNEADGIIPQKESGINNISIGQCMNVTPIQMIGAINTVTNNGVYVKPYIIESILDKDDNIIKYFETEERRIYSETTAKILKNAMLKVVAEGTGKNAYIENILIGGKTGSSTGNNNQTHGWFAGYFELDGKEYTMVVFTPEIEDKFLGGGDTAAPIFKDIVLALSN
ncbi:MAG: penicillin-binding protein 2 [Clostridium butyricum]|nr:penicillin-binding protein 2 [Clostridium butyricum]